MYCEQSTLEGTIEHLTKYCIYVTSFYDQACTNPRRQVTVAQNIFIIVPRIFCLLFWWVYIFAYYYYYYVMFMALCVKTMSISFHTKHAKNIFLINYAYRVILNYKQYI